MPLPQMLRDQRPEIRSSRVQNAGSKSQQSPRFQVPRLIFLLDLVGGRSGAIFLHGALEKEHGLVLEIGRSGQFLVVCWVDMKLARESEIFGNLTDDQVGERFCAGDSGNFIFVALSR